MAKKKFGDRRDAFRVKMPGLMQCCIDLKPTRMENEVYINQKFDVTALSDYIEEKKAEGIKYTYFHAFLTAIGIVIYNRPKLNRFITNRHLYQHNDITIAFVAKTTLDDKSEEIMITLKIGEDDNIATIADRIAGKIDKLRHNEGKVEKKGANSPLDSLSKLPNFIRVPLFGIIKWADRVDLIPYGLTQDLIYYSSMIVSNLGSIHCGAIYHNLANFGTASSLATIGEVKPEIVLKDDGTEEIKKLCEFGITLDERVGDGVYYAKSIKLIEYLLKNPTLLEKKLSEINLDGVL